MSQFKRQAAVDDAGSVGTSTQTVGTRFRKSSVPRQAALLETLRRQMVVTTIFDTTVDAAPQP